jgi:hypothetical protein
MPGECEPTDVLQLLLDQSHIVAYARFGADGALKQANPGFLRVIGGESKDRRLPLLVVEGQRGEVTELLSNRQASSSPRNLHFAAGLESPTTLMVSWQWDDDELVLLGGASVDDLETC